MNESHPRSGGPPWVRHRREFEPSKSWRSPIARHLYAARLGVPERAGDVSRGHRMQMHLMAGQADAVVDEVAAVDRAQGRAGVENIGRPLLDCRIRKQPRELVHTARDHAYSGSGLAQLGGEVNASRAGGAYNRNFRHDGAPMRSMGTKIVPR